MTDNHTPAEGNVIQAPSDIERALFPRDRQLRLVRIDTDDYRGWYLREGPDGESLLFLDHGKDPLVYDRLEQALGRLRQHDLGIYMEDQG